MSYLTRSMGARVTRLRLGACVVVAVVALAARAQGDQIITTDRNFRRAAIVGFENGVLRFRTPDHQVHRVHITEVQRMVVDGAAGLKDLNEAEEYFVRDVPEQAIPRYERALRLAEEYWPDLIRIRLLQARDEAGRFGEAVGDFVHVAERMPYVAAQLMVRSIPGTAGAESRAALLQIDAALKRNRGTVAESVLLLCRYAICRCVDEAEAERMAPNIASLPLPRGTTLGGDAVCDLQADAMERLLRLQRYDAVLAAVDGILPDASESFLPTFLLLKGRALCGRATEESEYIRAGWAFLRVVIHYSEDARVGEALLWAARVHEKIRRPNKAVQLLHECLGRSDLPDAIRRDAQRMLDRLTSDSDPTALKR